MKKSIIFASLALIVYLLTNTLMGVFAKQLNLIDEKTQSSFTIKEKFHHLNINMNVKGYCQINITQGIDPKLSFENIFEDKNQPEHFVKNDTLFVNMTDTASQSYRNMNIITGTLGSIIVSGKNEMTVSAIMKGSVMRVMLNGKVSFTEYNSSFDTLNIHAGNNTTVTIDSSRIGNLNFFHNKNDKYNFSINRSPLPEIREFDEGIISKPSE